MKTIVTLMTAAALLVGVSAGAMAHPTDLRTHAADSGRTFNHGYRGNYAHNGYHHGWRGNRGGVYYGGYDDGNDAWAGVLPGVVFGTILGAALTQ